MAISITDILMLFSGPAVITPLASIGGAISAGTPNEVRSQSAAGVTNITGVTVVDAYGNTEGIGTLQYTKSTDALWWYPPGSPNGTGKNITGDGTYTVGNAAGYLIIDVIYANFPAASAQDSVTISNVPQNIFDDITEVQSFAGNTEYRCFYLQNNHATATAYKVTIWVNAQPDVADTVSVSLDPAGLNGVALGPLADTEDTTNVLSALTFASPSSSSTGLLLGTMLAGESYAFWIKKVTPAENRLTSAQNTFSLGLSLTTNP